MPKRDYSPFAYEPRPTPDARVGPLTFLFAGMVVVLVCLTLVGVAHTAHRAMSEHIYESIQIKGGW